MVHAAQDEHFGWAGLSPDVRDALREYVQAMYGVDVLEARCLSGSRSSERQS